MSLDSELAYEAASKDLDKREQAAELSRLANEEDEEDYFDDYYFDEEVAYETQQDRKAWEGEFLDA